jgi:endonuclease G
MLGLSWRLLGAGRSKVYCLLVWVLLSAVVAGAAETNCPEHFAHGEAPDLTRQARTEKIRELCSEAFAVLHSGDTKTPLYVAQQLTLLQLEKAAGIPRKNRFHTETRLPEGERAELRDYAGSGYDRGHMAPAADMPDEKSQFEGFSLTNVVPQNPGNNRGAWAELEKTVRRLVQMQGRLYVITGPVFDRESSLVGGRVSVPSHLFKAVFISESGAIKAYLVENKDKAQIMEISIDTLENMVGLRLFPQRNQ